MLADQRSLFSLPDDLHYLNCASTSPLPIATRAAGRAALEPQMVPLSRRPDEYLGESEQLRSNVRVSWRGNSIRVSPHVYNTPVDIDALIQALIAASK